jgi:hypothetical protein
MADPLATTALVVSLVALLVTVGQLLQQYLSTADGYRRCRGSVMGLWSKKTRLRWRWSEFRFETVFVVPRIVYRPIEDAAIAPSGANSDGSYALINTSESLDATMTFHGSNVKEFYSSDELSCWVPLLARLHSQGETIRQRFPIRGTIPTAQFIEKSWDFMPLDIIRPMASSTVFDIAIMARRLGMIFKDFTPGVSMRAEGNGHVITSTVARSLGMILQYTFTTRQYANECVYLPLTEADKLGFGLVSVDSSLFLNWSTTIDLDISSIEGLQKSVSNLFNSTRYNNVKRLQRILRDNLTVARKGEDFIPGLNDLLPICIPMLLTKETNYHHTHRISTGRVPAPNMYSRGVTASWEGFHIFRERLKRLLSSRGDQATPKMISILQYMDNIQKMGGLWGDNWDKLGDVQRMEVRNILIDYHSEITAYLQEQKAMYTAIVLEHIITSFSAVCFINSGLYGLPEEEVDRKLVDNMNICFDKLPQLVSRVLQYHNLHSGILGDDASSIGEPPPPTPEEEIEDRWLAMMFRAFCWQRCHDLIEGVPPLPSEYWGSKMPVYIG